MGSVILLLPGRVVALRIWVDGRVEQMDKKTPCRRNGMGEVV
jgi:hypothetical protein